jgi:hypothetical protein
MVVTSVRIACRADGGKARAQPVPGAILQYLAPNRWKSMPGLFDLTVQTRSLKVDRFAMHRRWRDAVHVGPRRLYGEYKERAFRDWFLHCLQRQA